MREQEDAEITFSPAETEQALRFIRSVLSVNYEDLESLSEQLPVLQGTDPVVLEKLEMLLDRLGL